MSEKKVIEIVYDFEEQDFDFIVHGNADNIILGSEQELRNILAKLIDRLGCQEYPFAFLK